MNIHCECNLTSHFYIYWQVANFWFLNITQIYYSSSILNIDLLTRSNIHVLDLFFFCYRLFYNKIFGLLIFLDVQTL